MHRVELVSLCSIASLAYLHPRCELPEAENGSQPPGIGAVQDCPVFDLFEGRTRPKM
jgi:hypothetical protein